MVGSMINIELQSITINYELQLKLLRITSMNYEVIFNRGQSLTT